MSDGPESGSGYDPDKINNKGQRFVRDEIPSKEEPLDIEYINEKRAVDGELTAEQRARLQELVGEGVEVTEEDANAFAAHQRLLAAAQVEAAKLDEEFKNALEKIDWKKLGSKQYRGIPGVGELPAEPQTLSIPPLTDLLNIDPADIADIANYAESPQTKEDSEQQETVDATSPDTLLEFWLAGQAAEVKLKDMFPDVPFESQESGIQANETRDPLSLKKYYLKKIFPGDEKYFNPKESVFTPEQLKAIQGLYPSTTEQKAPAGDEAPGTPSEE